MAAAVAVRRAYWYTFSVLAYVLCESYEFASAMSRAQYTAYTKSIRRNTNSARWSQRDVAINTHVAGTYRETSASQSTSARSANRYTCQYMSRRRGGRVHARMLRKNYGAARFGRVRRRRCRAAMRWQVARNVKVTARRVAYSTMREKVMAAYGTDMSR